MMGGGIRNIHSKRIFPSVCRRRFCFSLYTRTAVSENKISGICSKFSLIFFAVRRSVVTFVRRSVVGFAERRQAADYHLSFRSRLKGDSRAYVGIIFTCDIDYLRSRTACFAGARISQVSTVTYRGSGG